MNRRFPRLSSFSSRCLCDRPFQPSSSLIDVRRRVLLHHRQEHSFIMDACDICCRHRTGVECKGCTRKICRRECLTPCLTCSTSLCYECSCPNGITCSRCNRHCSSPDLRCTRCNGVLCSDCVQPCATCHTTLCTHCVCDKIKGKTHKTEMCVLCRRNCARTACKRCRRDVCEACLLLCIGCDQKHRCIKCGRCH